MTDARPSAPPPPRVLVIGCGGIGGNVAGHLLELDELIRPRVVTLTTNASIAAAVNARGFALRGVGGARDVPGQVHTELPPDAQFDFAILATQPPSVEDAARSAAPHLADDGAVVVLQNGLCEERLAPLVGPGRVLGGIVSWGASMDEPGVYTRTSDGGFTIGRLDGDTADARLARLATLLEAIGPVEVTDNLRGARWSKLAINCAISTLGTIGGDRLGVLMRHRFVRRLALEVMTEVVHVARAEGVALQKVSGTLDLDWLALTPADRASRGSASLVAKHSLLLAVGARYRNLRSSMLAALERGRPPAVDFLNGEVVDRGERHAIPTPVNGAARALVHAISRGEDEVGLDTLRALARNVGVSSA
jgi:2-dehydropantoate 2-reductase